MTDFSGLAPIFPIPNLVFFPKTFLPLHIFEPRYLKMVLDAESNEKIICMTLLEEGYEDDYEGSPSIHKVGSLGYMELIIMMMELLIFYCLDWQRFRLMKFLQRRTLG